MRWKAVCLWAVAMVSVPAVGFAQGNELRWGVGFSFTPQWTANESITKWWIGDVPNDVKGSEFSVGVVRGRPNGGEWGVSYVHKPIKDGGTFTEHEEECFPAQGNQPAG